MNGTEAGKKRVAVISGGFGMLGKAIGKRLLQDGYTVALLYRSQTEKEQKEILADFPKGDIFSYRCDITDEHAVRSVVEKIEQEAGSIYAGIHCAHSPIARKKLTDSSPKSFRTQFDAGVFGGFTFLKEISVRLLTRRAGVLIGITTEALHSEELSGSFGGYIAAKHAVKGMLLEFRHDLEPHGIRVCEVAPGFMEGGLNADLHPRLVEFIKEKNGGSLTSPDDVAAEVSRLCS